MIGSSTQMPRVSEVASSELSWFQRQILKRFLPQSIIIEVVAFTWFIYFFSLHDWITAIVILVLSRILTHLIVPDPKEHYAETTMGKIALLHLHPANVAIQSLGMIVFLYGVWFQGTSAILTGLSIVAFGHWFGWSKVIEY